MSPIVPHFASECLYDLDYKDINIIWPETEDKYLTADKVNIVIQVNGKKRSIIETEKDIDEKTLIKKLDNDKNIVKYLENKEIKKTIFVKNRLLNLIIL